MEKKKEEWSCGICKRVFKKEKHLRLHVLTHRKEIECEKIVTKPVTKIERENPSPHTVKSTEKMVERMPTEEKEVTPPETSPQNRTHIERTQRKEVTPPKTSPRKDNIRRVFRKVGCHVTILMS